MSKSSNVAEIWEEAERRLGANRNDFSLVYSGHKLLPTEGTLSQSQQLFEIRWKGRGGAKIFLLDVRINHHRWSSFYPKNMTLQGFLRAHGIPDTPDRVVKIGNFWFEGALTDPIDMDARVYRFFRPDEDEKWIEVDTQEDGDWDIEYPHDELYELDTGLRRDVNGPIEEEEDEP
jgi:hypothetical protein